MKVLTPEQIQEHDAASLRGAIEGTIVSGSFAVAGSYLLHRRWPYYRSLPPSLKVMGVIIVVAPCLAIQAERRGLEYDRSQWGGAGKMELEKVTHEEREERESMNKSWKIGEWVDRHKWEFIIGSWVTGMGVSGTIISKNRYQTFAQKIVQARMWAQGLTIGALIAATVLAQTLRSSAPKTAKADHSWQHLLEEQARDEGERRAPARVE